MPDIPQTSITLLKAIAADSSSVRWTEFYRAYEGMFRAFLSQPAYASLEADDVIQETMLALMKALPDYHYVPDEKGHFRNWLTGIVKHKAMDMLRKRSREAVKLDRFAREPEAETPDPDAAEREALRESVREAALEQLLADPRIQEQHRLIFRRVALGHEKPEDVAAAYGTTRVNVDKIKSRLVDRLRTTIASMTAAWQ